jgi:hypothetical protein
MWERRAGFQGLAKRLKCRPEAPRGLQELLNRMPVMPATYTLTVPNELLSVARLAQLLQGLEGKGRAADPHQYRLLVQTLTTELREQQAHEALSGLLDHFPAAAEVYENLQYGHAGLVRAPLEMSLASELAARSLLERVRRE